MIFIQGDIGAAQSAVLGGIAKSTTKADAAIQLLDQELSELTQMLESITTIPAINGVLPALKNQIDPFVSPGTDWVRQANIDFNKPPDPVITPVTPNFPVLTVYSSQLLTDVKAVLDSWVMNLRSTGLSPAIEQQLWDRARERTKAATQGTIDSIGRQYQAAGWIMPVGDEIEAVYAALEAQATADITESRSIAVAQADLEQKNRQFSIQQAAQLEGLLGNMSQSMQALLVEEEKTRVLTLGEMNKLNVDLFKAEVDADVAYTQGKTAIYQADVSAYSTLVQAETAKVNAQVATQTAEINYAGKQADLSIEVSKQTIATMLAQKELSITTLSTMAKLMAQLVTGYFSSVNYGASISSSAGYSYGESNGISHSYPHKPGPAEGGSS